MKVLKYTLFLLLILSLSLSLFACGGGCSHADEDKDGVCDKCKEAMEYKVKNVNLIDEDGGALFQFVLASNLDSKAKLKIQELVMDLEDVDIEVEVVDDKEDTAEDCEVLIGDVKSRGDIYSVDTHSLGDKGYVIKIVDGKIVINGGSADALGEAIDIFIEEILTFDGDEIYDITMGANQQVEEIQNDYAITALKLLGEDMKGYTIATDISVINYYNAAKNLQSTAYARTGYWFEIVALDKASEKSIVIKNVPRVYGDESFKISVSGKQLLIECAFDNKLVDTFASFVTKTFVQGEGEVNFEGTVFKKDISFVTYEEFGATSGDKVNDFEAIYKAHKFANEGGQKVIISGSPKYYISYAKVGNSYETIPIETDTDWGNASFTIDDSIFTISNSEHQKSYGKHIFTVQSSTNSITLTKKDLPENIQLLIGMDKIDLALGYDALIVPTYSGHKIYRRRGYWGLSLGKNLGEILVIDGEGNIDKDTPVMWDYTGIDSIDVYYIDKTPLTVTGGTFTTIACKDSIYETVDGVTTMRDNYLARGISVKRSNTTLTNVKHYIEGEITLKEHAEDKKVGVCYSGFLTANFASVVTFDNCVLTAHRCYTKPTGYEGAGGTQGTYDFRAGYANKVTLKNCVQSNFWVTLDSEGNITPATKDTYGAVSSMAREWIYKKDYYHDGQGALMHWGIGETDFCKNLEYNGSTLSRFDAHEGLYNGKIINSEVNIIALTGKGVMTIENTTQYSLDPSSTYNTIIHMRSDYGSTWDGEIIIKDYKAFLYEEAAYVFMHSYVNWDCGYICVYPSIELDNVDFYNAKTYYETREAVPFKSTTKIYLNTGSHIKTEPQLHLGTTKNTAPNIAYTDYDGDGIVDNYDRLSNVDLNLDGRINDDDKIYDKNLLNDRSGMHHKGFLDSESKENLNPVTPPVYIKIINNDGVDTDGDGTADSGGVKYEVLDTSDDGVVEGGFFGKTKFYYSETEFYTGTGEEKNETDNTFIFSN